MATQPINSTVTPPVTTEAKARSLLSKIGDALENLMELKIDTIVTTLSIDAKGKVVATEGGTATGISTTINLAQGDVSNLIGGTMDPAALLDFHKTQVTLGRAIVADNLKALSELAHSLIDGAVARK